MTAVSALSVMRDPLSHKHSALLLQKLVYYIKCFVFLLSRLIASYLSVPTGAPEMFEAVVGQRMVVFSWSPPSVTQRNGLITSYTLSCFPSPSSLPQSPSQSGPLTVTGFSPDTSYSCSVVASNSQGSGPSVNTTFTTSQDCN